LVVKTNIGVASFFFGKIAAAKEEVERKDLSDLNPVGGAG
jgi:hypothetical protein